MADLNLRLELKITPRMFQWGIIGLLLSGMATELSSESVTLSTYYPAPSGVYTQMLTTQNTWLARDSGNVGVGTANPTAKMDVEGTSNVILNAGNVGIGTINPGSVLDIAGGIIHVAGTVSPSVTAQGAFIGWNALTGGTGETDFINNRGGGSGGFAWWNATAAGAMGTAAMVMNGSGNLGIGSTSPANRLSVSGLGAANVDIAVNGRMQTGDGSDDGGIWLSNGNNMFVGQNGTQVGFWTEGAGWNALQVTQAGDMYTGGTVASLDSSCVWGDVTGFDGGGVAACPGGYYGTMQDGLLSQYVELGTDAGIGQGGGGAGGENPDVYYRCCPYSGSWPP